MIQPAETLIACPVMPRASSEARYRAIVAISPGSSIRRCGIMREEDPLERLLLGQAVHRRQVGELVLDQRRVDEPGADRVDGDPVGGRLQRGDAGQPDQAVLGRAVGGLARLAPLAVDRGDVDDAAPRLRGASAAGRPG